MVTLKMILLIAAVVLGLIALYLIGSVLKELARIDRLISASVKEAVGISDRLLSR